MRIKKLVVLCYKKRQDGHTAVNYSPLSLLPSKPAHKTHNQGIPGLPGIQVVTGIPGVLWIPLGTPGMLTRFFQFLMTRITTTVTVLCFLLIGLRQ